MDDFQEDAMFFSNYFNREWRRKGEPQIDTDGHSFY